MQVQQQETSQLLLLRLLLFKLLLSQLLPVSSSPVLLLIAHLVCSLVWSRVPPCRWPYSSPCSRTDGE
jgi:hypothetical protein